ncbi:hypothetical protein HYH02_009339 [Chlamydomonas schloesseri]|uniref:Uncharacterized protein n=1 Tax=Chlamydomonas schloesseri TaxID=2026947 RepID=A0A835TFQ6_9CHLO|nr:hypothetical protein HYH02_009339 [Chlamydomonas schloesseri]|eukprot:KAG2443266.1 hypothetical protein HYH02_009339 [Chlamydomonas schloesseri]
MHERSLAQTHGTSHGWLWDPETLEPLVNSPAGEEALKLFRRLVAVGPTASDAPGCLSNTFSKGKCLLDINKGTRWKVGAAGGPAGAAACLTM